MTVLHGAIHDTDDLVAAVRELVKQYGALDGYVAEHRQLSGDRSKDYVYWSAQVWFRRPACSGDSGECVSVFGDTDPAVTLKKLLAELAGRKDDPIFSRDVMPDEIDEDPVQEVHI